MKFEEVYTKYMNEALAPQAPVQPQAAATPAQPAQPVGATTAPNTNIDLSVLDKARGVEIQKAIQNLMPNNVDQQQVLLNGIINALSPQAKVQAGQTAKAAQPQTANPGNPINTVGNSAAGNAASGGMAGSAGA